MTIGITWKAFKKPDAQATPQITSTRFSRRGSRHQHVSKSPGDLRVQPGCRSLLLASSAHSFTRGDGGPEKGWGRPRMTQPMGKGVGPGPESFLSSPRHQGAGSGKEGWDGGQQGLKGHLECPEPPSFWGALQAVPQEIVIYVCSPHRSPESAIRPPSAMQVCRAD